MLVTPYETRCARICDLCEADVMETWQNTGSNKYPTWKWVEEEHELRHCISNLNERIRALEKR